MTDATLTSKENTDPLPCPFCSSANVVLILGERDHVDYVVCNDCHTEGPFAHSPEAAVTKWNKRPTIETEAFTKASCRIVEKFNDGDLALTIKVAPDFRAERGTELEIRHALKAEVGGSFPEKTDV